MTAELACATGVGAVLGTLCGERLPQSLLRRGFAVLVDRGRARGCSSTCSCSAARRAEPDVMAGSAARDGRVNCGSESRSGIETRCTPQASATSNASAIASTTA